MKRASLLLVVLAGCQSSIDLQQGRPYACLPDAGDESACGSGWRCGIEGRCHAVGDAKPWPCREALDCEAGWVCGLENTCHDPLVARDYLCLDDSQCTAPWRCGFSGRCLDASGELGPSVSSTPTDVQVLAPRFFTGQPEAVVGASATGELAIAIGSRVRWIDSNPAASPRFRDFDAGGEVRGVLADSLGAYAVLDDGVRRLLRDRTDEGYVADGGPWLAGQGDYGPFVVHSGRLEFIGQIGSFPATTPDEPTQAAVANCAYFANQYGLWLQRRDGSDAPSPLSLSSWAQLSCGTVAQGYSISRGLLRVGQVSSRTLLAVSGASRRGSLVVMDAGIGLALPPRNFVAAIDVSRLSEVAGPQDPLGTDACVLPPPQGRLACPEARVTELLHCPSPCELGDDLTDVRPGATSLEVECTGVLGQSTWSLSYGGPCVPQQLTGRSSRWSVERTPGEGSLSLWGVVQRGPQGQLWYGTQISTARTAFLDEAPLAMVRVNLADDAGVAPVRPVTASNSFPLDEDLGFTARDAPEVLAWASGADGVFLGATGAISSVSQIDGGALVPTSRLTALELQQSELKPPFSLSVGTRRDAGVLIATVADGLYASDRGNWSKKMPLRVVPQPGFGITSLALTAGPVLQGFLSTRTGAFAFTSSSESSWVVSPIALPAGQVVEVWTDRGVSRVGYADGRVLTLPSGVPLAAPLPNGEFTDYLGACGQTWALSARGLEQLVGGQWVTLKLDGAETVLADTLSAGRLFERDGLVYVFNGTGGALSFRPSGGCPH